MLTEHRDAATRPLSLRAYSRRRGTSVEAVRRAIKSGRLRRSLVLVNGKPQIGDPDLADAEWAASTDLTKAPSYVKARAEGVTDGVTPQPPDGDTFSLTTELAREKHWKANQAELEFKRKAQVYKDAEAIRRWLENAFAQVKTRLLAVPSKVKVSYPELTHQQIRGIDALIREALDELADGATQAQADADSEAGEQ